MISKRTAIDMVKAIIDSTDDNLNQLIVIEKILVRLSKVRGNKSFDMSIRAILRKLEEYTDGYPNPLKENE